MSNNNTPIINYTLLKDALYKNTLSPEESSNAHVPIVSEVDGVKILQNILLSEIVKSDSQYIPNVIIVDTTLPADGSKDIEGKSYHSFAVAKSYCDIIHTTTPDMKFEIQLPSGEFDQEVVLSDYILVVGHNTILKRVVNSTVISQSKDLDVSTSVGLKDCTVAFGFASQPDISGSQTYKVYYLSNCVLDNLRTSTDGDLAVNNVVLVVKDSTVLGLAGKATGDGNIILQAAAPMYVIRGELSGTFVSESEFMSHSSMLGAVNVTAPIVLLIQSSSFTGGQMTVTVSAWQVMFIDCYLSLQTINIASSDETTCFLAFFNSVVISYFDVSIANNNTLETWIINSHFFRAMTLAGDSFLRLDELEVGGSNDIRVRGYVGSTFATPAPTIAARYNSSVTVYVYKLESVSDSAVVAIESIEVLDHSSCRISLAASISQLKLVYTVDVQNYSILAITNLSTIWDQNDSGWWYHDTTSYLNEEMLGAAHKYQGYMGDMRDRLTIRYAPTASPTAAQITSTIDLTTTHIGFMSILGGDPSVPGNFVWVPLNSTVVDDDTASTTDSITLADNTIFNRGTLASLTVTMPSGVTPAFTSQINFTSGVTPTTFSASGIDFTGDDASSAIFTPTASKRYMVMFTHDGLGARGLVSATDVIIEDVPDSEDPAEPAEPVGE